MDPYSVLGVSKNFNLKELKQKYKQLVVKYHPDLSKNVKSTPIFQALTESYETLLNELKKREAAPDHAHMKSVFTENIKKTGTSVSTVIKPATGKDFNANKFNTMFDKYSIKDSAKEQGYGDWLKSDDVPKKEMAIVHYDDPEPISTSTNYSLLGEKKCKDFSNLTSGSLQYMDLKKAHTTSKIVDADIVTFKIFKNLDDIKDHRSKIKFDMSEEDLVAQAKKKEKLDKQEAKRLHNLKKNDGMIEEMFNASNQLMLSELVKK